MISIFYKYICIFGSNDGRWLTAMLQLFLTFRQNKVNIIPVFDGKAPDAKKDENDQRKEQRAKIKNKANLLEECINKHKVDVIFMGCREGDFKNSKHCNIELTDDGWPQIIRVYPIFDWTYEEIWLYHKMYNLDYCSLYDEGYTSLGVYYKTRKNKELQNRDGTYKKAKDVNSVINERSYRE